MATKKAAPKKAAAKKAPVKKAPVKKAAAKKAAPKKAAPKTGAEARLATYKKKRDFAVTPEPSGAGAPASLGNRFVVQRHRARALHYDLRLEADGVLVSWAVPKGPTLDPDAKRMAVHVEDHPLDYFDFEGVIPSGEYGGGDVIVWDWGTWELMKGTDTIKEIEKGDLHFELERRKAEGTLRPRSARPRRGQAVAAAAQARRRGDQGLGRRGSPAFRQVGAHQRRGEGRACGNLVEHRDLGRAHIG